MPATLCTGGSYTLEIGAGFDDEAFILDASLLDGPDVLDGDGEEFYDITEKVTNIRVSRGRKQPIDAFGAGTMIVSMQQTEIDRSLDPFNTSSIYFNTDENQPGLGPLRPIRLSREGEFLFVGKVTGYQQQYVLGGLTTVCCVGGRQHLYAGTSRVSRQTVTSVETSAARLSAVLALIPYNGATNITAAPVATLGDFTITEGTNANEYANRINQAEQGRIFCDRANVLTMQPRIGTTLDAPTATFNDTGTETPYSGLGVEYDQQLVINTAIVEIESGGTPQTATDATSIAEYFVQSISITDSLLNDDTAALTLANYLLEGTPTARFNSISTTFASLTTLQKDTLAPIEIGDTVQITKTYTSGTPLTKTQDLAVEGVDHDINVFTGHRMTLYTSDTVVLNELILDDILYGTINTNNGLS
jgi:hypothetical protein